MIESPGLVRRGTALVRAADLTGTTECGGVALVGQSRDAVTYTYPEAHKLRTSRPWMSYPPEFRRPSLERVAHHEAAHVILLRWIGLDSPRATACATSGLAYMPALPDVPDQHPDPTGEVAACAAAIFHAGAMGELLHEGITWSGPLFYPEQVDYQMANRMLTPAFGNHASSGHAYAQRIALHVLQSRWCEVQAIASVLIERGEWVPV